MPISDGFSGSDGDHGYPVWEDHEGTVGQTPHSRGCVPNTARVGDQQDHQVSAKMSRGIYSGVCVEGD